ncbi:MAG: lysophospholipid acyltransferase family protein, partial [bacterium]|nr:lysophospholipid acyltransferase family protein [bacterium]
IWAEYSAVSLLLGFLGVLPRRLALWMSIGVAGLGFRLLGGLRKAGMRSLNIAYPHMADDERKQLLSGTFENLGRVLGEISQFPKYSKDEMASMVDFRFDEYTRGLYEQIKREKRGVLITTGHLGNWELLVQAFAVWHEPMSYLARPIDNPLIEDLTVAMRTRFGNTPLNKTNSARTAIRLLREGQIIGVLADVNAHPKEGVFVPFFDVTACTTAGPATLAIRTNAILFPIFCVYDHDAGKYKIVHGQAVEPVNTGDREGDIVATTAAYTAEIEKIIRQYPDQWLWIHKRWKTRPKCEPSLY